MEWGSKELEWNCVTIPGLSSIQHLLNNSTTWRWYAEQNHIECRCSLGVSVMIVKYPASHVPYWLVRALCPCSPDSITWPFPSHHPPIMYFHHPTHHLTCHLPPSSIFPYSTSACLVTCYTHHSHVMCMTMGSAWLFANLSSNRSHVARRALPTIGATCFGIVCELSICPVNFLICYILFCKLFLTCFVPHLLDYHTTCKCS